MPRDPSVPFPETVPDLAFRDTVLLQTQSSPFLLNFPPFTTLTGPVSLHVYVRGSRVTHGLPYFRRTGPSSSLSSKPTNSPRSRWSRHTTTSLDPEMRFLSLQTRHKVKQTPLGTEVDVVSVRSERRPLSNPHGRSTPHSGDQSHLSSQVLRLESLSLSPPSPLVVSHLEFSFSFIFVSW